MGSLANGNAGAPTATGATNRLFGSFLLILSFMCVGTLSDMGKMSSPQNHFGVSMQSQFTTKNNTRVIAQKGGLAVLPCVVKVNSPATVSWIRRKDFQLLTVGLSTHSSDKRFLVEHTRHMGHWSLRIKSVREEDRGLYECQLSIYPTQSIFIELKVVEAVAEITGAPDLHIDEGSMLRLECKLKRATENPAFVFWYHDSKMVNYDSQNGFSVTSVPGSSALTSAAGPLAALAPTHPAAAIGEGGGGGAGGGLQLVGRLGHSLTAREDSKGGGGGALGGAGMSHGKSSSGGSSKGGNGNGNSAFGNANDDGSFASGGKYLALASSSSMAAALGASAPAAAAIGTPHGGTAAAMALAAPQQQSAYLLTPSTSILTIREVHFHHGGNYTCAPSNARSASITVHVLRGERPAAMQHSNRSLLDGGSGGDGHANSSHGSAGGSASSGAAATAGRHHLLSSLRAVLVRINGASGSGGGRAYHVGCPWWGWCCHGSLLAVAAIAAASATRHQGPTPLIDGGTRPPRPRLPIGLWLLGLALLLLLLLATCGSSWWLPLPFSVAAAGCAAVTALATGMRAAASAAPLVPTKGWR